MKQYPQVTEKMMKKTLEIIIYLIFFIPCIESIRHLNEYIRHYEPLSYPTEKIHQSHLRSKRSVVHNNVVNIHFNAHSRDFHIRLKRDLSTFSDNLVIEGPSGEIEDMDTSHIYEGHLVGESNSYVFGSISDGVFHGKIVSPHSGAWYIERAHYYFPHHAINESLHSVMYHENDVIDPYANIRNGDSSGCGITEEVAEWMSKVQNSAEIFPYQSSSSIPHKNFTINNNINTGSSRAWESPSHKYTKEANILNHRRTTRATRPKEENRNTCSLFIQTDPFIWRHISEHLQRDAEKTREEILSLIAHHVTAVNYIYRDTRFDGKSEHRNIKFEVQRIKHDFPPECRPGGLHGNYIMFASATSGDRPNNSKFSKCSIGNISNVLDAMEVNQKRNCFTASAGAFCGNKIVEAGEECDCGYDYVECTDKCCYPRQVSDYDKSQNETAKGCSRRVGTQCSPSQGPCCSSETCQFVPLGARMECKVESECSYNSTCNGMTSECPPSLPRVNKTLCNEGTQLCINGECTGSICLIWNLTECFLTSNIIPNIDKRKLCELACQNGTDTASCRSTSEFAQEFGLPEGGISLRPGSPCDNFQGYCDVFLKCRAVDAEGPLARLKNLLFNKETLLTVAQWVTEFWWAVLLMSIAFIIFMGLFIKCCAVHTPSSNPKKPPAQRISDTLRRPMNTFRRMRYPHNNAASRHISSSNSARNNARVSTHNNNEDRGAQYYPKGS
ncbi:zinc-dependent metalloprotease kuz isoform X5 [Cotesia typhae]|uniref:zinc-dependent metalloprotease kuz isoform X5 n=1 Tax=Cotesia typhae TaxID=2053667 RepID=UPI003D68710A